MIVMSSHGELFYTEVPLSHTASSSPSTTFSGKDLQHVANPPPDFKRGEADMLLPTNFPFCILASLWLGKCSDQRKHSAPGFLSLLHLLANSSPLTWCCWWWWLPRKERIVREAVSAEGGTANSALSGNGIEN